MGRPLGAWGRDRRGGAARPFGPGPRGFGATDPRRNPARGCKLSSRPALPHRVGLSWALLRGSRGRGHGGQGAVGTGGK